ncbi:iron(III) transport system substrate-binding protein [Azospirillum sp. B510]|uniref:iron ABC transporter substrate-binding protein n=1 Tax=Azospirillum sp. (strain B510) TaxID=137722 RepID=UPI0001C4BFAE|nr:iron ABC transporter substrate-binding protein [Azospirillum sp. B510]BAI71248.1 iron(III) transport system substrate-binding protein [Azospirillum sp. B510]
MKISRSRFIRSLSLATALAALPVAALTGSASAQTAPSAEGITVYNAQHASLAKEWVERFSRETGIKVTVRNGSDMELGNQIVQEGAASPADVFLTENSPAMALVDNAGLFAPLGAETLASVPENFRPANGHWVGIAARSTVFAYNTGKLTRDKLPKSLLDLATPEWKGRWAASPAGADFQAIVGALLQLKGETATASWLKAMKENAKPYRGNSVAMKAVNAGEIEGAVIYHYYYVGDQARTGGENSKNVALHYFRNGDPGAFVSISGAGVLASSKNKREAEAFVRFLTGKGGQEVLRDGDSYEYAVASGVASNARLEPLDKLQAPKVKPEALNNKAVTDLMTAAGLL